MISALLHAGKCSLDFVISFSIDMVKSGEESFRNTNQFGSKLKFYEIVIPRNLVHKKGFYGGNVMFMLSLITLN